MFNAFRTLVSHWCGIPRTTESQARAVETADIEPLYLDHPSRNDRTISSHLVRYDENLLERSRSQWQFGDWEGLAKLDRETLQNHPDRAKLALLAAAGLIQQGHAGSARQFVRLAQDWGCNKKLVSQILVAGVYNALGRAAIASGQDKRSLRHFEESIRVALPDADCKVYGKARAVHETTRLGRLPQAARIMAEQLAEVKQQSVIDESRIVIIETELELLHHELSLAEQRQQLVSAGTANSLLTVEKDTPKWLENLKNRSVAQLEQDLWVLKKTDYKSGGFFVEFGATDGVLLSNSWLLEKEFDWLGICAEPNPKFNAQLKQNRRCIVSDQYIGSITGEKIEFILADAYGGSCKFADDDMHAAKREAYRVAGHVTTFTAISLNDFLEQHKAPRKIDYISIDTEGSEFELLSTFPFEKWDVQLFTIEHNFTARRANIRKLLEFHGYSCTEQRWDDWYEKKF